MNDYPIGFFDSGIGGLTTLYQCRKALVAEDFIYLPDFENVPYGNKSSQEIETLSFLNVEKLLRFKVKAIVIACNTATSVAAEKLRESYTMPIIGLEPALKPAFDAKGAGKVLLLCTYATAHQEKFKRLMDNYGGNVIVAPQRDLAALIEKNIFSLERIRPEVYGILSKYDGVSSVVLGCTHYVFIKNMINDFYCGRLKIYDGNAGAAKRLKYLLEKNDALSSKTGSKGSVIFLC